MAARRAAPQKPPKAAPPIPEDPRIETPAQLAQVSHDCPSAQATTERHTLAEEPDEYDPHHPPAEQRTNPQRDNHAHTRQPATTTTPPETPTTTLHYLTKHGEVPPVLTSRPTFASGHGQKLSEFTREILGRPAGEGPSSTAHPPSRQHRGADPGTCPWRGRSAGEADVLQSPPRARTVSRCAAC